MSHHRIVRRIQTLGNSGIRDGPVSPTPPKQLGSKLPNQRSS